MQKQLKICLAASAGGHLVQLLRLAPCWQNQQTVFISTLPEVNKQLSSFGKTYIVGDCNREHPLKTFVVLCKCFDVIRRERPDIVISTGAAPGFLSCFWGKCFGAKIIWVDSIANTNRLSLSGRMIRPFCDLCLTQWKHIKNKSRRIDFAGAVI